MKKLISWYNPTLQPSKPVQETVSAIEARRYLPLPVAERGRWKIDLLRKYLAEKGYGGIPVDPHEMSDYPDWLKSKGYKLNSIAATVAIVRKVYRDNMIYSTKILGISGRSTELLVNPVSHEQLEQLLEYADRCDVKERAIVYLKAYVWLRDVDISGLNAGDLCKRDGEYWLRISAGRPGKEQLVKVDNNRLLSVMLEYQDKKLQGKQIGEPMFYGLRGRMHPTNISMTITEVMRKSGIKRPDNDDQIQPHSLRNALIQERTK